MFVDVALPFPHQGSDSGGRCIEDIDLMLVYNIPEPPRIRIGWDPLEHKACSAITERTIYYVAVSGHPAYVGCTEVDVLVMIIKDPPECHVRVQHVSAGSMQNAFWFSGRA